MTATGIGASVKRKEDKRFITGKGKYTDDINLKDQTFAYFVRSSPCACHHQVDQHQEGGGHARRCWRVHRLLMWPKTRLAA